MTEVQGFLEKQVFIGGYKLNYAEGADDGNPPLLLIHGQNMQWRDYAKVLPKLAENYHVYAIDCHGHGKSDRDLSRYSCVKMGEDLAAFVDTVIGEPSVVSGHSSGGILAAWLAAYSPENVLGVVLEDPPLFSVTPEEVQNTFVWLDGYTIAHNFLNQTDEKDYVVYYMEHSYVFSLFGGLQKTLVASTRKYRKKHPDRPLKIWYLPKNMLHGLYYMDEFDKRFTETFYDGSWMHGVDQEAMLRKLTCPSVYIKATTKYGKDGVLYAANTDEDARKVHELISGNEMVEIESGHDIHFEKPKYFEQVLTGFRKKVT